MFTRLRKSYFSQHEQIKYSKYDGLCHVGILIITTAPTELWQCPACSLLGKAWARTTAQPGTTASSSTATHTVGFSHTVVTKCWLWHTHRHQPPTALLSEDCESRGVKAGDNFIAAGATDQVPEHPGARSPSYNWASGELLKLPWPSPAARQELVSFKLVILYMLGIPAFTAKERQVRRKKIKCLKLQKGHSPWNVGVLKIP